MKTLTKLALCCGLGLGMTVGSVYAYMVPGQNSGYRSNYSGSESNNAHSRHSGGAHSKPSPHNTFVYDPKTLKFYAYDKNGRLVRSGRASGGAHYCPDIGRACRTPVGRFKVHHRRGADCVSSRYPLNKNKPRAKMPHCNFFKGNYAIHGHNHVPNYNASHGCVRLSLNDARWLHHHFFTHGTTVIVKPYGSKKYRHRGHRRYSQDAYSGDGEYNSYY